LSTIHAIQVADQRLKEAKEEQMTQLIPAKRAADLAGELLQLRGRGGSDKSRALPADDVGLKKISFDTHASGSYVLVSMRIDVYGNERANVFG
jgi:hypothetical protein